MDGYQVAIRLRSRQTMDGETLTADQTLRGTLTPGGEGWTLSYREGADSGMGDTVTILTVTPGKVVLERRGEVVCRMVFRPGRRCLTDYATPYGSFPLELAARDVESALEDGRGRLYLRYGLRLGEGSMGVNRLELEFEREGP